MNLDLYCEYARENNVECCLSEIMIECNKHYIIKTIHDEIPSAKCASFEVDFQSNIIKITLINRISLQKEAFVLADLKYLYDPLLFTYTPNSYIIYKN